MFNKVMIVTDSGTDIFSSAEIFKSVICNITNIKHICFQMGPADVLDHTAQAFTFGGKLGIDATNKMPEELEFNSEMYIGKSSYKNSFDVNKIQNAIDGINDITGSDLTFLKNGLGIVIFTITKNRKRQVEELLHGILKMTEFADVKCLLFLDNGTFLNNYSYITWLSLANIDPVRDCYIFQNENSFCVAIDATKKNAAFDGFTREWPSIVSSDEKTIKTIDEKWHSLGFGKMINSPSLHIID
jgi:4-hydroxy-3-polyprenylbenzoate decarboxylase